MPLPISATWSPAQESTPRFEDYSDGVLSPSFHGPHDLTYVQHPATGKVPLEEALNVVFGEDRAAAIEYRALKGQILAHDELVAQVQTYFDSYHEDSSSTIHHHHQTTTESTPPDEWVRWMKWLKEDGAALKAQRKQMEDGSQEHARRKAEEQIEEMRRERCELEERFETERREMAGAVKKLTQRICKGA
ncbi:hypothetical protein HKX48_000095 [Thoreauomyces humboldtii]|nr:hypothetical protein HKX48_000095 [Thoreauomyces humboldtii]